MREKEKTTVPIPSVGADGEQSLSYVSNEIIATESEEINPTDENMEEILRQLQRMLEPSYLATMTMSQLYDTVYESRFGHTDFNIPNAILQRFSTFLIRGLIKVAGGKIFTDGRIKRFFAFVVFHFIQGCLNETCQRGKQALGFALVFSTFHFPFKMLRVFKATEIRVDSIPFDEKCASKWNQSVDVAFVFDFHACLSNHRNSSAKRRHNYQFQSELAYGFRIIGKFFGERPC